MIAILIAAVGVVTYLVSVHVGAGVVFYAVLGVVVVLAALAAVGVVVGASKPPLARWLMSLWTLAVIVGLGGLAAVGIALGVQLTAGDDASNQTKGIYSAFGGLITLALTSIRAWVGKHLAPWFATKAICSRYGSLFPCTPKGSGPGREAQEAMVGPCGSAKTILNGGPSIQEVLIKIKKAVETGEVHGGANWECMEPPAKGASQPATPLPEHGS